MIHQIAPSILSADFANLQRDIELINASEADLFHIDIMDGVFVPNISFGFPVLKAIQKHTRKPLDIHLMIAHPDQYLEQFKDAGAHNITVHYEACIHLHRTVQKIKDLGCTAGVAINPHTPVHLLVNIITEIDLVCLMSVNPGFGGQKFIPNTYRKINELHTLARDKNDRLLIEVDGGIDHQNASKICQAGANILVAGHAIFGHQNPSQAISALKNS
jgi:ribulose-phosphate 3-epimerase